MTSTNASKHYGECERDLHASECPCQLDHGATTGRPATINLQHGSIVFLELPYSEVCMHMRVAGKIMPVQITTGLHMAAQILDAAGKPWSFPVTLGEAGIYTDSCGTPYAYPEPTTRCANCGTLGYAQDWHIAIDWRCEALCARCAETYEWDGADWATPATNVHVHL